MFIMFASSNRYHTPSLPHDAYANDTYPNQHSSHSAIYAEKTRGDQSFGALIKDPSPAKGLGLDHPSLQAMGVPGSHSCSGSPSSTHADHWTPISHPSSTFSTPLSQVDDYPVMMPRVSASMDPTLYIPVPPPAMSMTSSQYAQQIPSAPQTTAFSNPSTFVTEFPSTNSSFLTPPRDELVASSRFDTRNAWAADPMFGTQNNPAFNPYQAEMNALQPPLGRLAISDGPAQQEAAHVIKRESPLNETMRETIYKIHDGGKQESPTPTRRDITKPVRRLRKPRERTTRETAKYECEICGTLFKRRFNFTQHKQVHNPDRTYPFQCLESECESKFCRRADLTRHHNTVHLHLREYSCDWCGQTFTRPDVSRRHQEECYYRPYVSGGEY